MESTGELGDISKLKVTDLKKELKARGLNTAGTKTELVERLAAASQVAQDAMSEDGINESEILDEDEVLGGEEEEGDHGDFDEDDLETDTVLANEPEPTPKPLLKSTLAVKRPAAINAEKSQEVQPKKRVLIRPISISSGKENGSSTDSTVKAEESNDQSVTTGKKVIKLSGVTIKERLELRAQKFGVPLSDAARKEARAARFGTKPSESSSSAPSKFITATKIIFQGPSEDVLKKRALKFGENVSSASLKSDGGDKLEKRQERFNPTVATATSLEEKNKIRAERYIKW